MRKSHASIEHVSVRDLHPYPKNARRHSKAQIKQIAASIGRFGFTNPVLISDDGEIIAGHGRVEAAKVLGMDTVPALRLSHLSAAERRAYVLADNKLALNAGWDKDILAIELQGLLDIDFGVDLTGFSMAEIDIILDEAQDSAAEGPKASKEDSIPAYQSDGHVTKLGDVWVLGRHKLVCGDARDSAAYGALLGNDIVDLVCTDPPYNVPIDGHVCGSGRIRHREFAMGVGEMNKEEFTTFLVDSLTLMTQACRDGAIAFVFMDWRHMGELLDAGLKTFTELKNVCVWNKTNGGMGTFYRSKHELVFVFKLGTAAHINNFGLGGNGRYRTNVWDYAGINSFRSGRMDDLEQHPTVKPVAMIADAIEDCTRRGDLVLDPFGGSGTTLIAAQKTGRRARLIEYDPGYCDVIIRRFEAVTGKSAILERTGQAFEDVASDAPRTEAA
jgi:DNA modification methylase